MNALFVLGIVVVAGLIGWGALVAYKKEQARIALLNSLALSKGWQFSAQDPYGLVGRWAGAPFNQGYDKRARNVVSGALDGHPLVAFDYSYKEDSSDSKGNRSTTTYHYAIYALGLPCGLPELHVAPEGVFGRLGVMLGAQDIELESEDFNRRFRVRCPDPKFATDVLSPRTMELLLAYPGKVHVRIAGSDFLDYEQGHLTATDVINRTGMLSRVIAGIPSFVWKDHGVTPPSAGGAQ